MIQYTTLLVSVFSILQGYVIQIDNIVLLEQNKVLLREDLSLSQDFLVQINDYTVRGDSVEVSGEIKKYLQPFGDAQVYLVDKLSRRLPRKGEDLNLICPITTTNSNGEFECTLPLDGQNIVIYSFAKERGILIRFL